MTKLKRTPHVKSDTSKCKGKINMTSVFYKLLAVVLGAAFGGLNCYHQYTMFENDRHFSHLSNLEREMTFRTEMGLYYYYYKALVDSPSFSQGVESLLANNLTEFPKTINTLKRFNLYPEVVLGAAFRAFSYISTAMKWETKDCFVVDRGEGFSSVLSCEGIGDPAYFYITSVFVWNSAVGFLVFIYGTILSDSIMGGLISAASFFFNHGECTRAQWTPPLRESFSFPFCLAVMLSITLILKNRVSSRLGKLLVALLSSGFLLTWQFAQFALLTETLCVYGVYMLGLTTTDAMKKILQGQIIGLGIAFLFLFGNSLLLCSFYTSSLFVIYALIIWEERFTFSRRLLKWVVHGVTLCGGSLAFKYLSSRVAGVEDDMHIWNLLKAKFTSYKDFHTLLYTCAVEFDFMEKETPVRLSQTLLLPCAIFVVIVVAFRFLRSYWRITVPEDSEVVYNVFQVFAFACMAILFMRLKLFLTPQLCILVSLVASRKYWKQTAKSEIIYGCCALLLAAMSVQGLKNIGQQRNILGEYSNPQLEDLLLWVNNSTPQDAVFAGPMPTMANLLLSTNRPIVNHPHYEDSDARARNKKVYTLYSRRSASDVHQILGDMGIQYAVLGKPWCYGDNKPGCSMLDLWDNEEKRNGPPLCQTLAANSAPFKKVFANEHYIVLKVN